MVYRKKTHPTTYCKKKTCMKHLSKSNEQSVVVFWFHWQNCTSLLMKITCTISMHQTCSLFYSCCRMRVMFFQHWNEIVKYQIIGLLFTMVYIVHTHWNSDFFSEKCGRGITLDRVDTQMQFWVIKKVLQIIQDT